MVTRKPKERNFLVVHIFFAIILFLLLLLYHFGFLDLDDIGTAFRAIFLLVVGWFGVVAILFVIFLF